MASGENLEQEFCAALDEREFPDLSASLLRLRISGLTTLVSHPSNSFPTLREASTDEHHRVRLRQ